MEIEDNQEKFFPVKRAIELLTAFDQGKVIEFSPVQYNLYHPLVIANGKINFDFKTYKYRVKI